MKRVSRGIFGKPHNRRVTTRFRFQSGTLGQAGIHIEPHSTEGRRLGYLKLTDGHIRHLSQARQNSAAPDAMGEVLPELGVKLIRLPRRSLAHMNRERVETVEEFKLRIAAIIRAEPEQIPSPRKSNPLLVRKKRAVRTQKPHRR